MTKIDLSKQALLALSLVAAIGAAGCKSGGGSRWAWNPWSKSAGEEAAALAESAPKLPSDGATPLIEGIDKPKDAAVAIATPAKTPPAMAGMAPTISAVAAATPAIDKPAPSSPNWSPYPTSSSPAAPTTPPTAPVAAVASNTAGGSPYDPNGYQPKAPAQPVSQPTDRYGIGNRYAAATTTPPTVDTKPFGDLPPATQTPPTSAVGSRYGAPTAPTTPAASPFGSVASASTPESSTPPAPGGDVNSRYPSTAPLPTTTASATTPKPAASAAPAYPTANAYPTASPYPTADSQSSTPIAQTSATASPYPVASGQPATASYPVASSSLGTIPAGSVYGAATTPVEPAAEEQGSVVRLTSAPGQYRPGGTSTYQPAVSVASRPEEGSTNPQPTSRY